MTGTRILIITRGIISAFLFVIGLTGPYGSSHASPVQEPTVPPISIGSPQGGDDWPVGTSQAIRWACNFDTAQGDPADVRVKVELLGQAGIQELLLDDNESDLSYDQGNRIIVLRLTPPTYPATLEDITVLVPTISGQQPTQGNITLYYFLDEQGIGAPPAPQRFTQQPATVTSNGQFADIQVRRPAPTLNSGDFYVGYEIRAPTGGFTFPIDLDNSRRRSFIAETGGSQFQDATFPSPSGFQTPGNLMVRAKVSLEAATIPLTPPEGILNTGEFCWKLTLGEGQEPMMGTERRPAQIKVTALLDGQPVAEGTSEQFSISRSLQSVLVTSPSANEIWRHREERIIRWTTEQMVGDARIELLRFTDSIDNASEKYCLFDGEEINEGQRSWEVGMFPLGFYKMRVSSSLDYRIFDESDLFVIDQERNAAAGPEAAWEDWAPFAPQHTEAKPFLGQGCGDINLKTAAMCPPVQVLTPNGGEVFRPGDRVRITWGSRGVTGTVRVVIYDLTRNPSNPDVVQEFLQPNTGVLEDWIVPFRLSLAMKIGVISTDDASIWDVSDGVFTIGVPGQARIRILLPDGGDRLHVGDETRIVWLNEGGDVGSKVRVDISFDGGISYRLLCDNPRECTDVLNNGLVRWGINIPMGEYPDVRIRIVSKDKPWISDVSNCSFSIIPPEPPDPNEPKCPPPRDP